MFISNSATSFSSISSRVMRPTTSPGGVQEKISEPLPYQRVRSSCYSHFFRLKNVSKTAVTAIIAPQRAG